MNGAKPGKVLVIDDDEMTLSTIRRLLEAEGLSVDVSLSAPDALARLPEGRYDAILCDMWMPGMTGKEFYQQVQTDFPEYQGRIIFFTGDIASEATWDFIEEGNLPYLLKPVSLSELRQKLQEAVGDRGEVVPGARTDQDKRRHHRVAIKAAARVRNKRWAGAGPEVIAVGNACKDGIYFVSNRQYRIGTELLVSFPYTGSDDIEQQGCVVRVDGRRGGQWGVAVALGEAATPARASLESHGERKREHVLAVADLGTEAPRAESTAEEAFDVTEVKMQLARARDETYRRERELADLKSIHQRAAAERDRLAAEAADRNLRLDELTSAKAAMVQMIEGLKHQVETLREQLAGAEAEREREARERKEAGRLAAELADLRVTYASVAAGRDRLAAEAADRTLRLDELTSANTNMAREIEDLKDQVATLQKQLTEVAAQPQPEEPSQEERKKRARSARVPKEKSEEKPARPRPRTRSPRPV